jgi:GNAT superfamily N-acetyltransferase
MKPAIDIRLAVPEDWAVIADYNSCLAMETEGKKLDSSTIEAGVQTLLSNPEHGRYFVACVGGQIVGQMMHTREWSDWRNGEIWWLQSVYVRLENRRCGVFRALFRHLEKLAESTPNVIGIRLYAEEHNSKAFDAYRSLGLAHAGYVVMERFLGRSIPDANAFPAN